MQSNSVIPGATPDIYPLDVHENCVLYYDMQDMGQTLRDHSGSGLDCSLTGATLQVGHAGYVRYFDGTDDNGILGILNTTAFNFGTSKEFSIEAWIRMDSDIANYGTICSKISGISTALTTGWILRHLSNGLVELHLKQQGVGESMAIAVGDLRNQWVQVLGVARRGAGAGNRPLIYINGGSPAPAMQDAGFNIDLTQPTSIGCTGVLVSASGFFKGQIGIVRIYNTALSAVEVMNIYRRDAWRYGLMG